MRRAVNMVVVFASMLASLGGTFTRVMSDLQSDAPDPNPKKRRPSGGFARYGMPMRMDGYYVDSHGSLRRIKPKRDKSLSARQWRKQRHSRRSAQIAKAEGGQ